MAVVSLPARLVRVQLARVVEKQGSTYSAAHDSLCISRIPKSELFCHTLKSLSRRSGRLGCLFSISCMRLATSDLAVPRISSYARMAFRILENGSTKRHRKDRRETGRTHRMTVVGINVSRQRM